MNRERITKINYLLTETRICSRGGKKVFKTYK